MDESLPKIFEKAGKGRIDAKPRVLIPTGLGINSQKELRYVFETAGAKVDYVLWNDLIAKPDMLDDYHGLALAGGFAMGDHLGAGQSLANRIRYSGFGDKLKQKLDDHDFPVYSVCNSKQIFAKLDLFPISVGTTNNDSGKHETLCWDLAINPDNDNVWLSYVREHKDPIFAPVSHGEGRIIVSEKDLLRAKEQNLIALEYADGYICDMLRSSRGRRYNPNGSVADIAGLGWSNNLVLFPHFERLHHDYQRPDRAMVIEEKGTAKGLYQPTYLIFKAGVDMMKKKMEERAGQQ